MPVGYHPAVDLIPQQELEELERSVHRVISACVGAMPEHEQFIARFVKAN
jgi:tryptophan halogenase